MKKAVTLVLLCAACIAIAGIAHAKSENEEREKTTPLIQLAILLDTSGSMNGLIEQAKTQLWKIVNEFATAKRDGKRPELQVALYQYGSSALSATQGYMRMILPLTTDLDKVSEKLFAFTTNGSEEYCGKVIKMAVSELDWSKCDKDYKTIFIAGNEPFTQGNVDYRHACKAAIEKGIIVNTIFCGPYGEGVSGKWRHGALLADGNYINIDQNRKVVHIDAPQDKEIARLGQELNKTYIPFGAKGEEGKKRQEEQEKNAQSASAGSNVERQLSKASSHYKNDSWDLVDAVKEKKVKLEDIKDKELPENMQKMNQAQRKAHVQGMAKKRKETQKQVNQLNEQRKKHIARKQKELSESDKETFDSAVKKSVRKQASEKGFKF